MTILAIGPRELPGSQLVEVWFDAGSGWAGQRVMVPVKHPTLSDRDRGQGITALYEYESYPAQGDPNTSDTNRSPAICRGPSCTQVRGPVSGDRW